MKYSKMFVAILTLEGILWVTYNGHLLQRRVWILYSPREIYEGLYLGGSFYSTGFYMLVMAVITVLMTEYCLKDEQLPSLVRHHSRQAYMAGRWKVLGFLCFMCVTVHCIVGFLLSIEIFPKKLVRSEQTMMFYTVSLPMLFFFLLRTNLIYVFARDFFNRKIFAIAFILGIYLLEFFVGFYVLTSVWMPSKDICLGASAYLGNAGTLELIIAVIRQASVTAIVAVLSLYYFDHKDVIRIER